MKLMKCSKTRPIQTLIIIDWTTQKGFLEKVSAGEENSVDDAARPTKTQLMNVQLKTSSAKSFPAGKSWRKEEYDDGGINAGTRRAETKGRKTTKRYGE